MAIDANYPPARSHDSLMDDDVGADFLLIITSFFPSFFLASPSGSFGLWTNLYIATMCCVSAPFCWVPQQPWLPSTGLAQQKHEVALILCIGPTWRRDYGDLGGTEGIVCSRGISPQKTIKVSLLPRKRVREKEGEESWLARRLRAAFTKAVARVQHTYCGYSSSYTAHSAQQSYGRKRGAKSDLP